MVIYLFNLVGYSWLYYYLSYRHTLQTVKQLDANSYNEADLIEVKVPLYLPYFQSWPDYERYDGEIELNGIHYNFVKRKVVSDTLYMLCLPDYIKTEMNRDKTRFVVDNTNDQSSSKQGKKSDGKSGGGGSDYTASTGPVIFLTFFQLETQHAVYPLTLSSCYIASPAKPPEAFS